jgi:pimeloyl-ACP methyl ester carboxylesterase
LERQIPAYKGDEPYVFVCYAHEDAKLVYPEIQWLQEQGVNVWYDEGISPGEEWSEELGQAIGAACRLVFFATPASASSRHCRNEIHFADNHDTPILAVHLKKTELPAGLELVIGASQGILAYASAGQTHRSTLLSALDDRVSPPVKSTGTATKSQPLMSSRRAWVLTTAAVVVGIAGFVAWLTWQDRPSAPSPPEVQFTQSSDGTRIAYSVVGDGHPVVYVQTWATNVEQAFNPYGPSYRFIHYDGRGFGLSQKTVTHSAQARLSDLEAVVDATGADRLVLWGLSAGSPTAIRYAALHPDRVLGLILYGPRLHGKFGFDQETERRMIDLVGTYWGQNHPLFGDFFLSTFAPDAMGARLDDVISFERTGTPANAAAYLESVIAEDEVSELAASVRVPTLILHRRGDAVIPLENGVETASIIPDARLVTLEGRGHWLLPGDKDLPRMGAEVIAFLNEVYDIAE